MRQYTDNIEYQPSMLARNQGLLRGEKAALTDMTLKLETRTKEKSDFEQNSFVDHR